MRFASGTGLFVSSSGNYPGALIAQGTDGSPITFTSNAASPAPGDWKGIYFSSYSDDATTLLEHAVVEYGGHTNNSNIYCSSASPTIIALRSSGLKYSPLERSAPIKETLASLGGSIPTIVTPVEFLALLAIAFTRTREVHRTLAGSNFCRTRSTAWGVLMLCSMDGSSR